MPDDDTYSIRLGVLRVGLRACGLPVNGADGWTDWTEIDQSILPRDDETLDALRGLHCDKQVGLGASCRIHGTDLCVRLTLVASDAPKSRWRRTDHPRRQDLLRRLFAAVEEVWEVDERGRRLLDFGVSVDRGFKADAARR